MIDNMKVVENPYPSLHHDCLEDEADDDTFSLSGFLMSHEPSNGEKDPLIELDHSFEFFNTQEWSHDHTNISSNPLFQPENIIFCGNIIPSKKTIPENTQNLNEKYESRKKEIENSSSMEKLPSTKKRIENMKKSGGGDGGGGKNNNVMAHKVTILRSSTRWHLYAFGMTKVPMEMELRDIRNRQSRRQLRPNDQSRSSSNNKVSVGCSNTTRSGGKGLWGLIREFGCNDHANTVVKASLVCIPRV